jgi:hypothetical protein
MEVFPKLALNSFTILIFIIFNILLKAPKYSGMLLTLGREWWVKTERRAACFICGVKFGVVTRRVHSILSSLFFISFLISSSPMSSTIAVHAGMYTSESNPFINSFLGRLCAARVARTS